MKRMRWIACALLTVSLLACAGCGGRGSASGGGSEHGSYGQAKIGLPF
jgi:hypothetical protein